MTKWLDPQPINISALDSLGLQPLMAQTLIRRGITTPESAKAFLDPQISSVGGTSELPGMDQAIERVILAVRNKEPICVWGDFDVDGQTSTAILVQTLKSLDADVSYHIPIRASESHGINLENLKIIIGRGVKLILTCDTGISAFDEVEYAKLAGVDFVITDHHDLPDRLPNASAIVNPKFLQIDHPLASLPGAGVAYKVSEALLEYRLSGIDFGLGGKDLQASPLMDLAALGIIADLALLKGETRAIAQKGISALRQTERLGLKTLAQMAGLDLSHSTEETISFYVAPRLNAIGRLDDANPAVELFLTKDPALARVLVAKIEGLNSQRRLLTNQVYQAAEAQLQHDPSLLTHPIILLVHPSWPGGVIGIVASRLVEKYHKPAILFTSSDDGVFRGSARSIDGLNITEAISKNNKYLLNFGGHPMAAGLSLSSVNFDEFHRELDKTIENMLGSIITEEPTLQVESWLELPSLTVDLARALEIIAPFGPGNPPVLFATRAVSLKSLKDFGKSKEHIKLTISDDQKNIREVVWWNGGNEERPDVFSENGTKFDLAYRLRSRSDGDDKLSIEFVEYRVVEHKPVEIRRAHLVIRDYRQQKTTLNLPPSTLIWAEGEDKSLGKSRYDLYRADELAVWTAPPSPAELHAVLKIVKPKTVYLFSNKPEEEKVDIFLTHLAGLTKFAINHRQGKLNISELASITAQRETTIKLGLEWLSASGNVALDRDEGEYNLTPGSGVANGYLQNELFNYVKVLLEETVAYRDNFCRADPVSVFTF